MATTTPDQHAADLDQRECKTCPVCGNAGAVLHEKMSDHLFGVPGSWSIRQCNTGECGCAWLNPRPVKEDLHKIYSNYYTHGEEADKRARNGGVVRGAIEEVEQIWLALLGLKKKRRSIEYMFLEESKPGKLLEVGCGDGSLMKRLQLLGWQVEGQDVDSNAAGLSSENIKVYLGELSEISLPENSYDAIVSNHVIEHADDPAALLVDCLKLLRPGGVLAVTTPNPQSYGHRVFGASWRGLDSPRHLQLLSVAALKRLAKQAGFSKVEVWTSPARAGGMLAGSRDIARTGHHRMQGGARLSHLLAAVWYQLIARLAHLRDPLSGEEAVLKAYK